MLEWLAETADAAGPVWQWTVIVLTGAIPFVESYLGSALGVAAGVSPPVAITAAVLGNLASMYLLVTFADATRSRRTAHGKPRTKRQDRLRRLFDKYGVPGVSLVGQTILPSQLTSMAMVAFGATKRTVILWQTISIVLWGLTFGIVATLGLQAVAG